MLKENQHFNTINSLYPHIGDKLEMFWGHLDFVRYVDKLIYDTRDGGRKGFPAPVFMAPIGVIGVCAQDGHGDLACARAMAFWLSA